MIEHTRKLVERGAQAEQEWQQAYDSWAADNPEGKALHDRLTRNDLSPGWEEACPAGLPIPKEWQPGQPPGRC